MARKPKTVVETPVETPAEAAPAQARLKGPRGVEMNATITLLVAGNPKRAGSKAYDRFQGYQDGMTVEQALEAGVTTPDLVYDSKHGFISIEGYDPGQIIEPKPRKEPKAKKEKPAKDEAEEALAEAEMATESEELA